MPISEVYNEDCMIGMARYPDKFWDLAICDPPYGIGQGGKKINSKTILSNGELIKKIDKRNGRLSITKPKHYHNNYNDESAPDLHYFNELFRVSKNQIVWGANHFISKIPFDSPSWIVWDKVNGDTDQSDCELAWTSFKGAVRQVEYMWNGFIQGKSLKEGRIAQGDKKLCELRAHPNHKPILLYKWLLTNYAQPGNKILDTHMGSQSSRIAAYQMGFDYYGWEIDKDYFEAGNKRFAEQTAQLKLL